MSSQKNKTISFLTPHPPGIAPGQRFRFEQYLELLRQHGFTVDIYPFLSKKVNQILYKPGNYPLKVIGVLAGFFKRLIFLPIILRSHYVFVYREASPLGPPFFEWLIAKLFRKKIIYDFDDAIWLPNTSDENRVVSSLKMHDKVKSICRWSYKISCGNEYLAQFAKQFSNSVVLNPTTIDTENLHNPDKYKTEKRNSPEIVIGWTGTHSTLHYLTPLLPVIDDLAKRHQNIQLMIICDKNPEWNYPFIKFMPWSKESEIQDLMKIDIGLMPLTDDQWSRGKCGFKALQYMSLEKPTVVSAVGVNTIIVDDNINGFCCHSPEEWSQKIELLLSDKSVREEMGRQGRIKVISSYSVISNSPTFLSLFE